MKLKKIDNGVQIKFDNENEKKVLELFLYHADLKSMDAIVSLQMFNGMVLNDEQKKRIKRFVSFFTTPFMQLAEDGYGCPDSIVLNTELFDLYDMFPDYLVSLNFKDGIKVFDLMNPFDWLFEGCE